MPNRSSTPRRRRTTDPNLLAAQIVSQATDAEEKPAKDPLAVELGRRGGLKGGKARAEKLSSKQRRAIASKAAKTRWKSARGTRQA